MPLTFESFAFVFTLAAVVNGLGIVRWVSGLGEYLQRGDQIAVEHYWVFNLFAAVQFLMHILLWWSLWGIRTAETFNFLSYLYLLTGPILLFLGSNLLMPDFASDAALNIREHYARVRRLYSTVYAAFLVVGDLSVAGYEGRVRANRTVSCSIHATGDPSAPAQ